MLLDLDNKRIINTNFIQDIESIDENRARITMANGKTIDINSTMDQAIKYFLDKEQHPPITHKVEVVNERHFAFPP